jgi:hypothetical protein
MAAKMNQKGPGNKTASSMANIIAEMLAVALDLGEQPELRWVSMLT